MNMADDPNTLLLLVQCTCFTTTCVLGLILLLLARPRLRTQSVAYEHSRWCLILALTLYAIHYLLQMIYGFRAQSEDAGTMVNIIFYQPIALLLATATLRISTRRSYLRRFITIGVIGNVINMVIFIVGMSVYHTLDMPNVLRYMEVVYVLMVAYFIFGPGAQLRRMSRKIDEETAADDSRYHLYMRSGTLLLYALGGIGALSIFSTRMVVGVAAFFLVALIFYVVSFVALGFSIQAFSSVVDEVYETSASSADGMQAEDVAMHAAGSTAAVTDDASPQGRPSPAAPSASLTPEQCAHVSQAIAAWRAAHGYSTINLNSITMAQQLGIPKRILTQYLAQCEGNTFRVWLSNLRIEETKRMLTDTDYSIEAIAESCGFSSRSWMWEKFKASTGMTPADWRNSRQIPPKTR